MGDGQPHAPATLTALADAAGAQHGQADLGTGGTQGALGDGRQQEVLGHARQAHGRGGPAAGGLCSGWAGLGWARLSSGSVQPAALSAGGRRRLLTALPAAPPCWLHRPHCTAPARTPTRLYRPAVPPAALAPIAPAAPLAPQLCPPAAHPAPSSPPSSPFPGRGVTAVGAGTRGWGTARAGRATSPVWGRHRSTLPCVTLARGRQTAAQVSLCLGGCASTSHTSPSCCNGHLFYAPSLQRGTQIMNEQKLFVVFPQTILFPTSGHTPLQSMLKSQFVDAATASPEMKVVHRALRSELGPVGFQIRRKVQRRKVLHHMLLLNKPQTCKQPCECFSLCKPLPWLLQNHFCSALLRRHVFTRYIIHSAAASFLSWK